MTLVPAIDVSGHQRRDLTDYINEYQPRHVIVKLYLPWEVVPQQHSIDQIRSAWDHGLSVGGYVWCYAGQSPVDTVNATMELCARAGLSLPVLWLDIETYPDDGTIPNNDWMGAAVEHADALGAPVGFYTSEEMWRRSGGSMLHGKRWLWGAAYGTFLRPFGGWATWPDCLNVMGHQYRGAPLDLSWMDARATGDEPVTDCSDELARIDRAGAMLDAELARPRLRKAPIRTARAALVD